MGTRLKHVGYGILERNRVNAENMESACVYTSETPGEMGMIVKVDKAKKTVAPGNTGLIGLLNNSEKIYDQYHQGLNQYCLHDGQMAAVLFLEPGNTFTTNTVNGGEGMTDMKTINQALTEGSVYAAPDAQGILTLTKTAGNCAFQVVKALKMPDMYHDGVKFMVIKNPNA